MTMERAVRITEQGGPEVIQWVDVELPEPGPGEVRMRNTAVGLNFIDTYHRSGLYPMKMPAVLGIEAAGVDLGLGFALLGLLGQLDAAAEGEMVAERLPFRRPRGGALRLGIDRAGVDEVLDLVLAERAADLVVDK